MIHGMRSTRSTPDRVSVNISVPFDSHIRRADPEPPKGLFLVLHGYDQSGPIIMKRLSEFLPKSWTTIAPNAPFPIPHWDSTFPAPGWRKQKLRLGYTWYHYQSSTKEYFFDMSHCLEFLERGVEALQLSHLPKIVIGFSQGGYVAPFIAQRLQNVKQVICLSCEFLPELLTQPVEFPIDGIFGDSDPIADIEAAKASHAELLSKGIRGGFHVVPGVAHDVPPPVAEQVQKILMA